MDQTLRLLAIFPHPDDESLGLGGTLAKYAAEGVETYLVCATRGEQGWNGPEEQNPGMEALGQIREAELRCAAGVLGLREVNFLGYIDGELDQAQVNEVTARLVSLIRRIRPQVVVTFSVEGNYGHPDHIALSQFTSGALVNAADGAYSDPLSQPPHRVLKYYHMVDSKNMVLAVTEISGGISMEVDGEERSHFGWDDWAITTRIDTAPYIDQIQKAVLCHQSQLPGYGALVELPRQGWLRFWSEGTFLRIYSLVNSGRQVERDLFAGLR